MKKLSVLIVVLALCGVGAFAANNDNHVVNLLISPVAAIVVDGADPLQMIIDATGITAGSDPAPDTDATTRLQYTMIQPTGVGTVTVSATGTVPTGTRLRVSAVPASGGSVSGDTGTAAGNIDLTGTNPAGGIIINSIASCKTGSVAGTDGSVVTYVFSVTDFTSLVTNNPGGSDVTVTYTIAP